MAHTQCGTTRGVPATQAATHRACARFEDCPPSINLINFVHPNRDPRETAKMTKQHIMFLEAKIIEESSKLLTLAHSCIFCDNRPPFIDYEPRSLSLPEALINDTKNRLRRMEEIAKNIKDRRAMIKRLEGLRDEHCCRRRDAVATIPGVGREIRPTNNRKLDGGAKEQNSGSDSAHKSLHGPNLLPSLVDTDVPYIRTSVLKPTPASNASVAAPATSTVPMQDTKPRLGPIPPQSTVPGSSPTQYHQLKQPFQIWKDSEHRLNSLRQHRGGRDTEIPLIFRFGIQYDPSITHSPHQIALSRTHECRMVLFQDLDPKTSIQIILDKVRGGPILRAGKADATTAYVCFVRGQDAYAYVEHVNNPGNAIHILSSIPRIALAGTPSYPLRRSLENAIFHQGVTRALGLKPTSDDVLHFLLGPRFQSQIEMCYGKQQVVRKIGDLSSELKAKRAAPEDTEAAEDDPSSNDKYTIVFSYRTIDCATRVHQLLRAKYPECRVYFAPDRCAEPLEKLQ
ncbi:hypothetical protein GGS21DRAFT_549248 [Xylaria nigripes]|nr:hypothetical protein GGS21DRAFT_549248 [Xylaria nigripes]